MKRLAFGLMLLSVIGLAGCETVRGFGRDVSNVGDAIMGN